jgi:hypothetical protein
MIAPPAISPSAVRTAPAKTPAPSAVATMLDQPTSRGSLRDDQKVFGYSSGAEVTASGAPVAWSGRGLRRDSSGDTNSTVIALFSGRCSD